MASAALALGTSNVDDVEVIDIFHVLYIRVWYSPPDLRVPAVAGCREVEQRSNIVSKEQKLLWQGSQLNVSSYLLHCTCLYTACG